MPASVITFLAAQGAAALTGLERALSFLNTNLFGNFILAGLNRSRKQPAGAQAQTVLSTFSVRQAISPWQVVIGQRRVGGTITFVFLSSDKKYLHMVVTLACHASEEIGDIWLDDEVITPGMLDASGVVNSGKYSRIDQLRHIDQTSSTSYTTVSPVDSVESVASGPSDGLTPLVDVSPSAPSQGQYKRAGNVFTFNATDAAQGVTINYTENFAEPICRIKKSLGGEIVQAFPDLIAESEGKWVDADRQTGHTKVYIRFDTSMLQGNAPAISAVLKGLKLFDPRTGLTTWSANTALAVIAYMMNAEFGLGAAIGEIGSSEFTAAANVCDERVQLAVLTTTFTADAASDVVTLATGSRLPQIGDGIRVSSSGTLPAGLSAGTTYFPFFTAGVMKFATSLANALAGTPIDITSAGSGTHTLTYYDEPRYRANGAFLTSERPVDVLQALLGAMAGTLTQVSSTWRVFAGAYEAATLTLTEKDFAGPIQIEPMPPRDKWANGAKGVFVDPNSNWQPTDFPAIVPTSPYLAEDGGEAIYVDLDLTAFVTSSGQTQRLARIAVRQARSGLVVSALFKLTAWRSFTGHSLALTFAKYGWSAKEFTIVDSGFALIQGNGAPALGVQLTLRETNAAIFSWAAEDQAQSTPPHTSLPNPFSVAAPGAPAVTETLYETTGSAGVKSRATVSWTAIVDPLVQSYGVSWKQASESDYNVTSVPNGTSLDIDDLAPGLYVFAVRADNGIAASAWSPYTVKSLLGLTAPPSNPTNFSVIASNGFAEARWDLSPDLDVRIGGRAIVRFSPLTTGAAWEDGILISGTVDLPGFPGDTIKGGSMPLKTGTYLLKFQDSSGNYSTTAASFVATEGMVTGFSTVVTITEDAAFTGSKTQVVLSGSQIQLDTSGGSIFATGSYAFAGTSGDLVTVVSRRFEATIKASSFDIGSNIDSILANIDDWDSIDGGAVNDCNVQLMIRVTNDDPAGSPTWGPWTPFHVGDFSCRAAQFRLDFTSGNPNHNIAVTQLRVAIKVADVAPLASPALTGTPTATTAAVDTTTNQIATTAFVTNQATSATPAMDSGAGSVGTSKRYARGDHVHPVDTSRADDAQTMHITPAFTSAEQSIPTGNTVLSVSHGLGRVPADFRCILRCKTAELGFSVGDEIDAASINDQVNSVPVEIWANATSCKFVAQSSTMRTTAANATGLQNMTSANWRIVFYAW